MDLLDIYNRLKALEFYEQVGRDYYLQKGSYIDYYELMYYLDAARGEHTGDFSCLDTAHARQAVGLLYERFEHEYSGSLPEQLFMPERKNVQLEHLLRYVDIHAHKHDFFEMVFLLEGQCVHEVGSREVYPQPGDITIIPPGVPHHLFARPDCVGITVKLRKSTFESVFYGLFRESSVLARYFSRTLHEPGFLSCLTFHCGNDIFMRQQLLYMYAQQEQGLPYTADIIEGLLSAFFPYLLQNYEEQMDISESVPDAFGRRLLDIENYLRLNYRTATLDGAARHFYLSRSYLSTLIHKGTGCTFSQLLRKFRLMKAEQLLVQTDMKLEEICESVGYKDVTQFIRSFKAMYGQTPRNWQRRQTAERTRVYDNQ